MSPTQQQYPRRQTALCECSAKTVTRHYGRRTMTTHVLCCGAGECMGVVYRKRSIDDDDRSLLVTPKKASTLRLIDELLANGR